MKSLTGLRHETYAASSARFISLCYPCGGSTAHELFPEGDFRHVLFSCLPACLYATLLSAGRQAHESCLSGRQAADRDAVDRESNWRVILTTQVDFKSFEFIHNQYPISGGQRPEDSIA